ncbi:MAG: sulfotransferase [Pseudoxanthomonas sp.]
MQRIDSLLAHAEAAIENGDWPGARAAYLQVLSLDPAHAQAMLQLSYVESFVDDYRAAGQWAQRTAALRPEQPRLLMELIRRLRTFNQVPAMRDLALRLIGNPRIPVAVLAECARQLNNVNDFGLALQCAQAALGRNDDDVGVRLVLGQLLAHHGRLGEAAGHFEWVLARNPNIGAAWWLLARLARQTPQSNHVQPLRKLLAAPNPDPNNVASAARALHKELDDLGDHEGAWRALQTMCKARRGTIRHDADSDRKLVDALIAMPAHANGIGYASDKTPIFIVGMHRSGTTLLEQLLDAHPSVAGLGELFDFPCALRHAANHYSKSAVDAVHVSRLGGADLTGVGKRYLDGVAWRLDGGKTHFTDKLPANFLNIGFILRALPQAKILHMVRDPVETCFSSLRELFSDVNPFSYDQVELAEYFVQYRRLMAHWHGAFPGRILDVEYARLTADPEATMRKVASFCGLEYREAMRSTASSSRAVATASAVQVRGEVARRETPKWLPYRDHLQPLIETLRAGGVAVPEGG